MRMTCVVVCLFIGPLLGCAQSPPATTDARFVAETFTRTCLRTAMHGRLLRDTFLNAGGFTTSDRPAPGPNALVFEGPETTFGVLQSFRGYVLLPDPETGSQPAPVPPSRTCSVYAQVSDPEALHRATDLAIRALMPQAQMDGAPGQAARWNAVTREASLLRITSSRIAQTQGMLHPLPGNVVLTVRQDV